MGSDFCSSTSREIRCYSANPAIRMGNKMPVAGEPKSPTEKPVKLTENKKLEIARERLHVFYDVLRL